MMWWSPEAGQLQRYSYPSDVFSFGVILWEICSRRTPQRTTDDVSQGLLEPLPSEAPAEIATILFETTKFDPAARPTFCSLTVQLQEIYSSYQQEERRLKSLVDEEVRRKTLQWQRSFTLLHPEPPQQMMPTRQRSATSIDD
jgi:serine/threonine protein kinase